MKGWLLGLWGLALAQEAVDEDTDAEEPPPAYTVTVVAERRVEIARQQLYDRAREEGYRKSRSKDDRVILRHDQPWKGDLVVFDDGRVELKRQPIRFEPPVANARPVDYLWCVLVPICIRPTGQTYGKRKWRAAEARALAAVRPEVERLQERVGDLGLAQKTEALPGRLEALWERGVSLEAADAPAVETPQERREALAAFWLSRTDTPEGRLVREVVQAYVRNEVQYSDHPFTPEEIADVNRRARHREPFLPGWETGDPP